MKKETNTDKSEAPILIYQDADLIKYNKELLEQIFSEIGKIKKQFAIAGVDFDKVALLRTINEGTGWITDNLYDQACEFFKGKSDFVKKSIIDRSKLQEPVLPIEPLIKKVIDLLNQIGITPDQVPFDENSPIITSELKNFLSEKSKRYAVTEAEKELYFAVLKFIESTNALEACLAKNQYPLLFTKFTSAHTPLRYAESETFAFPLCLADYDNLETDGHAILTLNPEVFQDYAVKRDAANFFRENAGQNPEVNSYENRSSGIPAAGFRGRKEIEIGEVIKTPESKLPKKDRWKGIPGV